jgi:ubiquinone biosynthesis protein
MLEFLLEPEKLVPEVYQQWRPLVRDSLALIFSSLSANRLTDKIAEQMKLPPNTPPETRLVRLIRRMPCLQKLGQVLARNRHLDAGLRSELTTLENGIRDIDFEEIEKVIESKLGDALKKFDINIEPSIFSEASVSAVVRFTYPEGRGVFKVLKPYISECFEEDMRLLQKLADFIASGKRDYGFSSSGVSQTFAEIRTLLRHEVEFACEQANLIEAERSPDFQNIRTPRLLPHLCTPHITAMTEEAGIKATDVAAYSPNVRWRIAERLVEALVLAPLLSESEEALFHADPHAGNLLYDAQTDQLAVLDWALTGRLTRNQRRQFCMLLLMLGLRDAIGVSDAISKLSLDNDGRRPTIETFLNAIPFSRIPGALDAISLLDQLGLDGAPFPPDLLMFRKALFTLDGVLHDIAGDEISLDAIIANYLAKHWPANLVKLPLLLQSEDWAALIASSSLYPARLFLQ